ncbi:MAG: hypothetical protein HY914_01130 [Desulfomonile tiedjei]|nr:hypothetical protein [Desulfomonile tiedjei]
MKKVWVVVLAGLLIAAMALPAFAWEFEMKGEFEHRLRYFGRTGNNDLFGVGNLDTIPGAFFVATPGPQTAANGFYGPGIYDTVLSGGRTGPGMGFAGPSIYGRGAANPDTTVTGPTFGPTNVVARNLNTGNALVNGPMYNLLTLSQRISQQVRIVRGGFSSYGSDALYHETRLTLRPAIKVNPAIRVFGVYNIGGYRNKYHQYIGNDYQSVLVAGYLPIQSGVGVPPFERYYSHQTSNNAYDTAAIGSWEQVRATITTPWAIFSIGIKDFPFGTGATLGENTRAEAFLTVVPYGPFRILHGVWLARGRGYEGWVTSPDSDHKNSFFQGMLMTYNAGEFELGAGTIVRYYHGTPATQTLTNARDDNTWINLGYFKFNNGRFFADAEYAWLNVDRYFVGLGGPGPVNNLNSFDGQGYHAFAEAGMMAGPAKLSLMYAQASGAVLNNKNRLLPLLGGGLTDPSTLGLPYANPRVYLPFAINWQAMEPYEFLMFNTYGGGNNGGMGVLDVSFVTDEHMMMTDGFAFAGRLDYAVASNLNVYGSYIWAHRLEKAGWYIGNTDANGATGIQTGNFSAGALVSNRTNGSNWTNSSGIDFGTTNGFPLRNPYVDDGFIGWEANVGVDWKLLEGMTFKTRYSYWQPGDWFTWAYQAFTALGPGLGGRGRLETRSAIQAFQASILVDF